MTILDRLLGHDAWTTRQLLLRCRELSEEKRNRPSCMATILSACMIVLMQIKNIVEVRFTEINPFPSVLIT